MAFLPCLTFEHVAHRLAFLTSSNEILLGEEVDAGKSSGGVTITEGEIIHFALLYDPQSFHLDVTAAEKSPYGGLIASGFHTLSLCFRLFMQRGVLAACSMGSPGIDEVRWLAPVRPGDTLRTETEVLEVKPSSSKPDRGILRMKYVGVNQHGAAVISFVLNHLLRRRRQ